MHDASHSVSTERASHADHDPPPLLAGSFPSAVSDTDEDIQDPSSIFSSVFHATEPRIDGDAYASSQTDFDAYRVDRENRDEDTSLGRKDLMLHKFLTSMMGHNNRSFAGIQQDASGFREEMHCSPDFGSIWENLKRPIEPVTKGKEKEQASSKQVWFNPQTNAGWIDGFEQERREEQDADMDTSDFEIDDANASDGDFRDDVPSLAPSFSMAPSFTGGSYMDSFEEDFIVGPSRITLDEVRRRRRTTMW